MAIKLYSDSCSDLTKEMAKEFGVGIIPLIFTLEGHDYADDFGESMPITEFYEKVRKGSMPKTALINTQRYLEEFSKEIEKGNEILYLCFSSALSGSYQCAVTAEEELREKYPDCKIAVVDSKCASFGEGLFVYYVANKLKEGVSFEALTKYAFDLQPSICHLFTVDDLNHLARGGRASNVSAVLGTALKIKPVLHVDDEGRLVLLNKQRGRVKAMKELINLMKESADADTDQTVFISHGDCLDEAETVGEMVKEAFPNIKDIKYSFIGPVVGSHSGPGTIALFFVGSKR
ncbi:MAG: DegV family protein [Eubacteriales bacterium]